MTRTLAEVVLNGLITGSIYALIGAGIALIYGTMRVLNFAQGELLMIGGYLVLLFAVTLGWPILPAAIATVALTMVAGAVLQRAIVAPLLRREDWAFQVIAATIGLSIVLQSGALLVFGEQYQTVRYFFEGVAVVGDVRMPWQRIAIFLVAAAAILGSALLLYRTGLGRIVRATAQDAEAALAMGIPAGLVHTTVFAMAAGLAAVAAILLAPLLTVNPWMGLPYLLKGFAAVILGGLGSFSGAIVAGLLLGLVESASVVVLASEWRDVVSLSVLILVIWLRPQGLFRER